MTAKQTAAEQRIVLASLMQYGQAALAIIGDLDPECFTIAPNKTLYATFVKGLQTMKKMTWTEFLAVADECGYEVKREKSDIEYLRCLNQCPVSLENLPHFVNVLNEQGILAKAKVMVDNGNLSGLKTVVSGYCGRGQE